MVIVLRSSELAFGLYPERNMACGVPAVEVRAAAAVFALAFRGAELVDLAGRVAELEAGREPPWT